MFFIMYITHDIVSSQIIIDNETAIGLLNGYFLDFIAGDRGFSTYS